MSSCFLTVFCCIAGLPVFFLAPFGLLFLSSCVSVFIFLFSNILTFSSSYLVLEVDVESGIAVPGSVPGHLADLLPPAKMISPLMAGDDAFQVYKQSGADAPRMVEVLTAVWQV